MGAKGKSVTEWRINVTNVRKVKAKNSREVKHVRNVRHSTLKDYGHKYM